MKTGRLTLLLAICASAPASAQTRHVIGGDSTTWVATSGSLRLRAESWSDFGAGATIAAPFTGDDAFALSRLLLRGQAQVRGRVAFTLELKSSLAASRDLPGGARPADKDVFDVQQAYVDLIGPRGRATLRGGRFDLALGRERLVSPLDWSNTRRTFQGASLRATGRSGDLVAFYVRPITVRREKPNIADTLRLLYGLQLGRTYRGTRAELYWLRSTTDAAAFNGTAGAEQRHTIGARVARPPARGKLDADVEAAWQAGRVGPGTVGAWMTAAQLGYSLGGRFNARMYLGADAASGDKTAGGNVTTFNQLYPLSHAYLGYIDVHGRQNVIDLSAGASLEPLRALVVLLDAHAFSRQSTSDALYAVDGSIYRPAGTNLPSRVGSELDLTVRRAGLLHGRLALQAGASAYFIGPFLEQSGPASDMRWVYGQATVTF